MEQVFFRLHVRFVSSSSKIMGAKMRRVIEYGLLFHALACLALLVYLHVNFVSANGKSCCLKTSFQHLPDIEIVRIKIISNHSEQSQQTQQQQKNHEKIEQEHFYDRKNEMTLARSIQRFTAGKAISFLRAIRYLLFSFHPKSSDVGYIFAFEKGYIVLHNELKDRSTIRMANITIPSNSPCFGNPIMSTFIENVIGYDTIVMNDLIRILDGRGYLYNLHSKQIFNLSYAAEFLATTASPLGYIIFKLGILFTTLFLFFTTTSLVSFTLRQTQKRMLKFTFLLQHHIRNRLPYARLVLTHVVESLVFVPIMVGMLFFLFEFFNDQLLAFMMLSVVWLCELFSVHAMFHFWSCYEVPALQQGYVSFTIPRQLALLQHEETRNTTIVRSESNESLESEASNSDNNSIEDVSIGETLMFTRRRRRMFYNTDFE